MQVGQLLWMVVFQMSLNLTISMEERREPTGLCREFDGQLYIPLTRMQSCIDQTQMHRILINVIFLYAQEENWEQTSQSLLNLAFQTHFLCFFFFFFLFFFWPHLQHMESPWAKDQIQAVTATYATAAWQPWIFNPLRYYRNSLINLLSR